MFTFVKFPLDRFMLQTMRRLHPRGAANRGLCVDAAGAVLGPACVLVDRTPAGFRGIDREHASTLQKCVLDGEPDDDWLFRQSQRIANALNKGEIALAQIYGLRIPVRELDDRLLKRLGAGSFGKWSFNPDEPRIPKGDPHGGEWTTGGDGSSAESSDASGTDANQGDFLTSNSDGASASQPEGSPEEDNAPTDDEGGGDDGSAQPDQPPIRWEMKPLGDAAAGNMPALTPDSPDATTLSAPTLAAFAGDGAQWLFGELPTTTVDALKLLMGRLGGAATVFGILFIPTNSSTVVEGPIAGSADLSYRYDGDTGVLQLRQDIGSLGPVVFDEAHIGGDGLFRDSQGLIIGRYLSNSGLVVDLSELAGNQTLAAPDQDRPKLCPDPNAESIAGRSERSLAYQEQISGLPRGLEVTLNGVRFDGCIEADGTMLEAKGPGFENKMDGSSDWQEWFTGDEQLEAQMERQSDMLEETGRTVEWHFAEQPVADFFRKFAEENDLTNIRVIYTPPRWR
jgi:hypothetical protein